MYIVSKSFLFRFVERTPFVPYTSTHESLLPLESLSVALHVSYKLIVEEEGKRRDRERKGKKEKSHPVIPSPDVRKFLTPFIGAPRNKAESS